MNSVVVRCHGTAEPAERVADDEIERIVRQPFDRAAGIADPDRYGVRPA